MSEEMYMHRALELAASGMGHVSPNPMVGCVIVHAGKIIGEGYHERYGGPHAEVNAVASIKDKSLLAESTVYVTLEPCSHFGKTPPCADLLILHRVKRVVVCNMDPNPVVSGRGLDKLRAAGIEVETGLFHDKGEALNRRFFTAQRLNRPYVILKWAQTTDGFVARENFDSKWISNPYSRQMVHKWRSEEDAILVGKNTAKYDNPSLTTRDWHGKSPIRVVIDRNMELEANSNFYDQQVQTICFTEQNIPDLDNLHFVCQESITPAIILQALHERDIQSLIVEGGSNTLQQFIDADLWDEARVFTSETYFGTGIDAPTMHVASSRKEVIFGDQLKTYFNQ